MESKELKVHWILLYSFLRLSRPRVVIPFTAVQECAVRFRSHSASSQNLNKVRGGSSLDRGHQEFPRWLSLPVDVGLYAVAIKNSQPIEGGRDVQVHILSLVEHLKNFVRATSNNMEFPFVSIFGYQHQPWLPHIRQSNVSVHLQDHMHLASAFLSKHCTHRIEGTFSSMHVIIHGQRFMRATIHSGKTPWKMVCTPLINLERR